MVDRGRSDSDPPSPPQSPTHLHPQPQPKFELQPNPHQENIRLELELRTAVNTMGLCQKPNKVHRHRREQQKACEPESTRREVQVTRNRLTDPALHLLPLVHDLRIADADHVVPAPHQLSVVLHV